MGNKTKNLSEEQVSQIAERVGAQLKQKQASATDGANRRGRMSAYLVGGASGLVLALAAPFLRPVMRSAVKGGILVGRYARQVGSNMKEEFEDIAAEAEAELDNEKGEGKGEVWLMHHIIGFAIVGAALGGISATGSKRKVRPALRSLVKGGIVAQRKINAYRATALSEAQKLVDEARAELDQPRTAQEA
jgi:Protein of unknown function (DUF5132)